MRCTAGERSKLRGCLATDYGGKRGERKRASRSSGREGPEGPSGWAILTAGSVAGRGVRGVGLYPPGKISQTQHLVDFRFGQRPVGRGDRAEHVGVQIDLGQGDAVVNTKIQLP